ncbi:hypothetical protein LIER_38586 [Lithospermum erythrorhizon]|uniref:Reverse transcriptase n=1 Tax=Lithospermum erythrorhizon TaxID=34254 RepID=A0AAV3Q1Z7_LITER
MLRVVEERKAISGIRISRESPSISHILFVDDTMIFCRATMDEGGIIMNILKEYEVESRQMIDINKCSVSFSPRTGRRIREDIMSILGLKEVRDQGKYLGLPSQVGRTKNKVFRSRIRGWKSKLLSQFFWANSDGEKGIHWKAWESLCLGKLEGGLGFKNLECMNLALLAKQGWRVATRQASLLFKLLKGRYLKRSSFLHAKLGNNPSYGWRNLQEGRAILLKGAR